jgi:radical SAM protein with 4Fe4S-binding SPASM domain
MRRADPIGTNELAVDRDGVIYPSWRMLGNEGFRVGVFESGKLDEAALSEYENLGSTAVAGCRRCWARNLCGGGNAAVHYALSGSVRKPNAAWCDAQRSWMGAAVSAFNLLSSLGVNFTRVYNTLTPSAKPSLFTMLRAAMGMTVVMRPIEESDAEMLVRWENWDESAYFLFNERGTLLATKYDREMDSLHPQSFDMEMILVRKSGQPIGLLKFRPDKTPGVANGWLYLRKPEDYASDDIRKGFRFLLKQASAQQSLRRIVVPAAAYEKPLQDFLTALGFTKAGTQREALYLHNKYHDVHMYSVSPENL